MPTSKTIRLNHTDPDGKTCARNEDGKGATCWVDDPNGLRGKALDRANQIYTRAVNRLLYNPERKMHLQARDSRDRTVTAVTTAGKVAQALMAARVRFGGDSPISQKTGKGCCYATTSGTVETPKGVNITLWKEGLNQSSDDLAITIIHEGAHGTRANVELHKMADPSAFDRMHQFSFRYGSTQLYENYDQD